MSNIKILQQDVINSLKHNLNECNIEDLISEFKSLSKLNFVIKILKKGYKCYESFIQSNNSNKDVNDIFLEKRGFGRTEYEALSNAVMNLVESLLQHEKYVDPIQESLKIFHNSKNNNVNLNINNNNSTKVINSNNYNSNNKNSNTNNNNNNNKSNSKKSLTNNINLNNNNNNNNNQLFYYSNNNNNNNNTNNITNNINHNDLFSKKEKIAIDNTDSETKALVSLLTKDNSLILCHEEDFTIDSDIDYITNINNNLNNLKINIKESYEYIQLKKDYKEKNLIIKELKDMIIDIMTYNKKLTETIEAETDNYPDFFKCPISWEKLNNPVVSIEGHSYEKWAIDKWLLTQDTSPITGLTLNDHTLVNNYALKSALDDFNKRMAKWKRVKQDMYKFLTKCEYDLNDLQKYFGQVDIDE